MAFEYVTLSFTFVHFMHQTINRENIFCALSIFQTHTDLKKTNLPKAPTQMNCCFRRHNEASAEYLL